MDQVKNKTIDNKILSHFFFVTKDSQQEYIYNLSVNINIMACKFDIIQAGMTYFQTLEEFGIKKRDPELMIVLRKHIQISETDPLKLIISRSKRLLDDIKQKKMELERLVPKDQQAVKIDIEYFTKLIVRVNKQLSYQINKKETLLSEFAEMVCDFHLSNKKNNGR